MYNTFHIIQCMHYIHTAEHTNIDHSGRFCCLCTIGPTAQTYTFIFTADRVGLILIHHSNMLSLSASLINVHIHRKHIRNTQAIFFTDAKEYCTSFCHVLLARMQVPVEQCDPYYIMLDSALQGTNTPVFLSLCTNWIYWKLGVSYSIPWFYMGHLIKVVCLLPFTVQFFLLIIKKPEQPDDFILRIWSSICQKIHDYLSLACG